MNRFRTVFLVMFVLGFQILMAEDMNPKKVSSPLQFTMESIDGNNIDLGNFKGNVVLMVNVASKCGFTPQYEGLQAIYEKYKDDGFVVLGFPANNFANQEPGSDKEIKEFCTTNYGVTFPMFSKISVKGDDQHPLYQYLTNKKKHDHGGEIGWNFTKFLINRDGEVVNRFESKVKPRDDQVIQAIESALKAS